MDMNKIGNLSPKSRETVNTLRPTGVRDTQFTQEDDVAVKEQVKVTHTKPMRTSFKSIGRKSLLTVNIVKKSEFTVGDQLMQQGT